MTQLTASEVGTHLSTDAGVPLAALTEGPFDDYWHTGGPRNPWTDPGHECLRIHNHAKALLQASIIVVIIIIIIIIKQPLLPQRLDDVMRAQGGAHLCIHVAHESSIVRTSAIHSE